MVVRGLLLALEVFPLVTRSRPARPQSWHGDAGQEEQRESCTCSVRAPPPPRHARVSAPAWPPRGTERAWTYNASLQRVFGLVAAKVRRTRVTTLSTGCKNVTGSGTGRDARLTLYGACSHSVLHIRHGSWRAPRLEGNTTERAARPPPFSALSPRCEARWRGRPPVAATAAAAAPLQTPQQRWRRQQRDVSSSQQRRRRRQGETAPQSRRRSRSLLRLRSLLRSRRSRERERRSLRRSSRLVAIVSRAQCDSALGRSVHHALSGGVWEVARGVQEVSRR